MSARPLQRRPARLRFAILRCAILLALPIGSAVAQQEVSPAEVLLFETDHMERMKAPATLVYEFRKLSNVEPAFTDSVLLDVSRKAGQVHAALRFLTGARKHALPEMDDAHGNPVLLGFLEHDIVEMKRLTGGSVTYFRKRIRMALANSAQVTPQRITYQGKALDGKAVRIQPYLDDPLHARFEHYVRKTYTFILSDGVPGGIYQVSTSLTNTEGNRPAPGTVVARTAAAGATAPGAAAPGTAVPGSGAPMQARGVAPPPPATQGAARPGKPAPGTALPVIDETLTLVKVLASQR
jgi:hypothetical protein